MAPPPPKRKNFYKNDYADEFQLIKRAKKEMNMLIVSHAKKKSVWQRPEKQHFYQKTDKHKKAAMLSNFVWFLVHDTKTFIKVQNPTNYKKFSPTTPISSAGEFIFKARQKELLQNRQKTKFKKIFSCSAYHHHKPSFKCCNNGQTFSRAFAERKRLCRKQPTEFCESEIQWQSRRNFRIMLCPMNWYKTFFDFLARFFWFSRKSSESENK